MKPKALFAYVTIFSMVFTTVSCSSEPAPEKAQPPSTPEGMKFFSEKGFDKADPQAVVEALRSRALSRDLTHEEYLDLGTAWFLQQRWDQAAAIYEAAAAKAPDDGRRGQALFYAAQCLAVAQKWRDAGQLANLANRVVPASKELAGVRKLFWQAAGDKLEESIAQSRMEQINVELGGKKVCDPGTVVVVAIIAVAIVVPVMYGMATDKLTGEQVEKMIIAMFDFGGKVCDAAIAWSPPKILSLNNR